MDNFYITIFPKKEIYRIHMQSLRHVVNWDGRLEAKITWLLMAASSIVPVLSLQSKSFF